MSERTLEQLALELRNRIANLPSNGLGDGEGHYYNGQEAAYESILDWIGDS